LNNDCSISEISVKENSVNQCQIMEIAEVRQAITEIAARIEQIRDWL